MSLLQLFEGDPDEALAFRRLRHPLPRPLDGVAQLRFELASRGDRVLGRLLLPDGPGPSPLLLMGHGTRGAKDASDMDAACCACARAGAAVAAVDLPLHGERASAKLSEIFLGGFESGDCRGDFEALVWSSFLRQAVVDLRRSLAALSRCPEIDAERMAFVGFGLGGFVGIPFCAEEPRIRAAAFAGAGAGVAPVAVDPLAHAARLAPRPVLYVNAARGEVLPRKRAETLHTAAGEPKRVEWCETDDAGLAEAALPAITDFLSAPLGLTS